MTVRVTGTKELIASFDRLKQKTGKAVARGTTRAAMLVQGDARRRVMKGPKSGRRYGKHRASAPGQSPANDTGNLARSISVVAAAPAVEAVAYVQARTDYAAALEFGTLRAGRGRGTVIEARPFLRPAMEATRVRAAAIIKEELDKAFDGGSP